MSAPDKKSKQGVIEGSQLKAYQRIMLLWQKPYDIFPLTSAAERKRDAFTILILYFVVSMPYVVHKNMALGKLDEFSQSELASTILQGLAGGIIITSIMIFMIAVALHLILNIIFGKNKGFEPAWTLPLLSLAPQLVLVFELPYILLNFGDPATLFVSNCIRLVLSILTLRTFYWGLRSLYEVSKNGALFTIAVPLFMLVSLLIAFLLQ